MGERSLVRFGKSATTLLEKLFAPRAGIPNADTRAVSERSQPKFQLVRNLLSY